MSSDPSEAANRTRLAWQRTALAVALAAVVLARLRFDGHPLVTTVPLTVGALVALWVVAASRWAARAPAGRVVALSATTLLVATTEMVAVLR